MNLRRPLIALALVSSGALADDKANDDTLLGAAVRSRPRYDGSAERKADLVPVVRYSRGIAFARTTHGMLEGGARTQVGSGVVTGVQLAYEPGPLDEDPGASIGAHVEWTANFGPAPVNALARFRKHTDSARGQQLDARLTVGVYGRGGLRVGLFGQATWASEKHLVAYYGRPDSGLLYTSAGVLCSYELSSRWRAVGIAESRRLADAPARSPIVEDRTGTLLTIGVAYGFN